MPWRSNSLTYDQPNPLNYERSRYLHGTKRLAASMTGLPLVLELNWDRVCDNRIAAGTLALRAHMHGIAQWYNTCVICVFWNLYFTYVVVRLLTC